MADRSYQQYCGVAAALDVLGERWTLLIVRDLVPGPLRYRDLAALQPHMASDLLTARLRKLEERGLLERTRLPPPASADAYRLTEAGRALEAVVGALAVAGSRLLPRPSGLSDAWRFRVEWGLMTIAEHLGDHAPDGGGLEVEADGWITSIRRVDDSAVVERAARVAPDVRLRGDDRTLLGVLTGHVTAEAVEVEGSRVALERWLEAIAATAPPTILAT